MFPAACLFPSGGPLLRVRYTSELLRQVRQFHRHGSTTEVASVQLFHPHLVSGAEEYLIRQRLCAVPLIAENVAFPDGSHPPVDTLPLLPPHLRERYEKLEHVTDLSRLPPLPQRLPRSCRAATDKVPSFQAVTRALLQTSGVIACHRAQPPGSPPFAAPDAPLLPGATHPRLW